MVTHPYERNILDGTMNNTQPTKQTNKQTNKKLLNMSEVPTWIASDEFPVAHSDSCPYSVVEWAAGHSLAHGRIHRVDVV